MENNKTIQVDIDLLKKIYANLHLGAGHANAAFGSFGMLNLKLGNDFATLTNEVLDDIIKDIEQLVGEK